MRVSEAGRDQARGQADRQADRYSLASSGLQTQVQQENGKEHTKTKASTPTPPGKYELGFRAGCAAPSSNPFGHRTLLGEEDTDAVAPWFPTPTPIPSEAFEGVAAKRLESPRGDKARACSASASVGLEDTQPSDSHFARARLCAITHAGSWRS